MKDNQKKILFFDIGGVLLSNGWETEFREDAAEKFGIDYAEMAALHDFIFNTYEIGKITLDEYLDTVIFHQPRDFSKSSFTDYMYSRSTPNTEMLTWLKSWKKTCHCKIFSINNEGKELNDYRIKTFGLHDCFDGFISSGNVGYRKPDPDIYRMAMGIAHARPEECVYFDDREMLVHTARRLGMTSHLHIDYASTRAIIEELFS